LHRDGPYPYGIAPLSSSLVHDQFYDITVSLHVPRSPPNLATGNFMLSLSLLSPSYIPPAQTTTPPSILQSSHSSTLAPTDLLFLSRRPAILTYNSRLVSLSSRLLNLPLYLLGLKHESERLHIPMAEGVRFKNRKGVPRYVMLELQKGQEVQVYDARIQFTARFGGLRWMMYNHRILSFFIFTTAFWFTEVIFLALGWIALRSILPLGSETQPEQEGAVKGEEGTDDTELNIKKEEEQETDEPDLSDTPRTFPTYGRQQPLRYTPKVKDEDSGEYGIDEVTMKPLEADDEDDEFGVGVGRDSGIGTSFSDGGERAGAGLARRRSRGGRGTG
jgi:seipin